MDESSRGSVSVRMAYSFSELPVSYFARKIFFPVYPPYF